MHMINIVDISFCFFNLSIRASLARKCMTLKNKQRVCVLYCIFQLFHSVTQSFQYPENDQKNKQPGCWKVPFFVAELTTFHWKNMTSFATVDYTRCLKSAITSQISGNLTESDSVSWKLKHCNFIPSFINWRCNSDILHLKSIPLSSNCFPCYIFALWWTV